MAKFQLRRVGVRREPASRERRDRRERDWCERGCEQDRRGEGRETGAGPTIRMGGEGGMPDSRARSSGICGRVHGRARGGAARRSGGAGEQGRRRWGRGIRHRSRTCIDHRESSGRRGGERLQQERGLGCARTQSTKEPPSAPSRRDQQIGEVSRRGADPGHPGESHDPGRGALPRCKRVQRAAALTNGLALLCET